jgi:two-component system chemotaxis response regulator CheY
MENINIVLVEDQREVLQAIAKDLKKFEDLIRIEECESAKEAAEVIKHIAERGDHVAVIVSDHVMPVKNGVDFLIEVNNDPAFKKTRKILLTALATHQDTIQAINKAHIDLYLEKPWTKDELMGAVSTMLTHYVFDAGLDYSPYTSVLNSEVLFKRLSNASDA